jgi:signal transduction histidine kinase
MLDHVASIRDLATRFAGGRGAGAAASAGSTAGGAGGSSASAAGGLVRAPELSVSTPGAGPSSNDSQLVRALEPPTRQLLQNLAVQVASDEGKQVRIDLSGFEDVPEDYARLVKDVAIQLVRNAVSHGIETPAERERSGKPPIGSIRAMFETRDQGGFRLSVQDDGRGVSLDEVRRAAVARGMLDAEQAEQLGAQQLLSVLFQPGFSTRDEAGLHAGRGVGLDVVATEVRQARGRIAISSEPSTFTRIVVALPELASDLPQSATG